jgi:poly(3-hydroxyalkanoate) synthetase
MIELLLECSRVRKILPQLTVPTLAFQSHTDELVSVRSCRDLEGHPYITNTVLFQSGHFAYGKNDAALLQTQLIRLLAQQ